jgi:hypothetical protein
MSRFAFVAAVAGLLAAGAARAQSYYVDTRFSAVDAVRIRYSALVVTGIVEGEAGPSDRSFQWSSTTPEWIRTSCERLAVIAMDAPGRYVFTVEVGGSNVNGCKLARTSL